MEKFAYDLCLKLASNKLPPDDDPGILADVAHMCVLVRFSLFFTRRSLRQPLPSLAHLAVPPLRLQRFLRGCVAFTADALVTAPARDVSVFVEAQKKMIWGNCIFMRVLNGIVVKEEVRLQATAAVRIARKSGVIAAAASGDVDDVLSYLIAHENCVYERGE
jgi:hypothetical protein